MDNLSELVHQLKELCAARIPELKKRVSQSIGAHEKDFLRLGDKLQDFSVQAGSLAGLAGQVLDSMAGQNMSDVIQGFNDELHAMSEVCSTRPADDALGDLRSIVETIEGLEEHLREFNRLVRKLQMLGISTRIESARLGSDGVGFHTLADDVEKLGNRIEGHSSKISQHAKALSEFSHLAMRQTATMRDKQSECSASIFSDIRNNLDTLLQVVDSSNELSEKLALRSKEAQRTIGEIVSSLQFHDIVRQQVEHVDEALDDIANVILHGGDSQLADHPEHADLAGWVADVAHLQVWQVRNGAERFEKAVQSIIENMQELAAGMQGMQEEITGLLGKDASSSSGTLQHIEGTVDKMLETMKVFAGQGEEIGATMSSVATTISEISSYLEDIEEVGAEIELIALNASIKAAHTGEQGAAMGVLAMNVQQLSKEASKQTDDVAGVLRSIAESADMLGSRAADFLDTSQVRAMVESLKKLLSQLKEVDSAISSGFAELSRQSADLAADIKKLTRSVTFHESVSARLAQAAEGLEDLETSARSLAPDSDEQKRPERLKKLLERYTMDAERLVHEQVFAAEPGAAAAQEQGGEDWDNVELF